MEEFSLFFLSVVGRWIELVSGCLVLAVLGLIEKLYLKREVSIRFYLSVLACLVFWASFGAWNDEHSQKKQFENQLLVSKEEMKTLKEPDLHCDILAINSQIVPDDPAPIRLLFVVDIRNLGAPSIADEWELLIKTKDGKSIQGTRQAIPPSLTITVPRGTTTFHSNDAIYNKVTEEPIQKGGKKRGILWFWFEKSSASSIDVRTVMQTHGFMLTFKDVTGKTVTATSDPNLTPHDLSPGFPGINVP